MNSMKKLRQLMNLQKEKSDFKVEGGISKPDFRKVLLPDVEIFPDGKGEFPEEFIITDDGIYHNGRRVILYIRDQAQYFVEDRNFEYKFHVAGCMTLKAMINKKHYAKYVLKREINNIFKVNLIINNESVEKEMELHICKNCLSKLNWKGYKKASAAAKNFIYENFSIEEFFDSVNNDNQKNFEVTPEYTDATAPLNVYPPNWAVISKVIRTEAGYICDECGKIFPDGRGLHVHHRNTIKSDCSRANLEVLCAACHQKKHNHKIWGGQNF